MKFARQLNWVVWLGLLAAPLLLDEWRVSQLAQLLTYGIFALSLAFIWGQAGILCFGQAIFFGVGAYVMALITLGMVPPLGTSQWTGLLLAVAAASAERIWPSSPSVHRSLPKLRRAGGISSAVSTVSSAFRRSSGRSSVLTPSCLPWRPICSSLPSRR